MTEELQQQLNAWPDTGDKDVESSFDEFWKEIVCLPDGTPDLGQIKRELHDFLLMITEVPKVYNWITGGRISKPLTTSDVVIVDMKIDFGN